MALMQVELTNKDFGFTATDAMGNEVMIDIPVEQGGKAGGFRPMQTLLAGLGGCSGVDVVSILKKQRQEIFRFNIQIDGEREEGVEPSLWKQIQLNFDFEGNIEPAKAYRAVELSINKYCSVAATLRKAGANLSWSVIVNGSQVNP